MSPDPKVGNAGGTVSVKGKVLDAAGSPAANINVPIFKGDTQIAQVTSNSEGVFTAELTNDAVGDVVYKFGVASDYEQGQWTIKWLNPTPITEIEFAGHNEKDVYTTDEVVLIGKAKLNGQPYMGDTMVNFNKNNRFQWGQLVTGGEFRQPLSPDLALNNYYCTNVGSEEAIGSQDIRWTDPAKMPASFEMAASTPTTSPIGESLYLEVIAKDADGQGTGGYTVPWYVDGVDQGDIFIQENGTFTVRGWTNDPGDVVYTFGSPLAPAKQLSYTVTWVDNTPVYSGIIVLPSSDNDIAVGKTAEVTVKTVDQFGNAMANQNVVMTIPGELPMPARPSDNKGECLFLIDNDTVGAVTYSFQGFGGDAVEHTINWKAAPTVAAVTYSPLSSAKTPIGGDARTMVLVTDSEGNPMSGKEVVFKANDASGEQIATGTTNFSGLATCGIPQDGSNLTRTVWAGIGDKADTFEVTWADGATIGMSISNIDFTSRVEVGQRGMLNVQVRNSLGEFLPSASLKLYDSETYEEIPCNLTRMENLGWITADLAGTGVRQFYIVTDSNYSMAMMNWDDTKNTDFTGLRVSHDATLSMPLNQDGAVKGFVSSRWGSPVTLNKLHKVVQVIDGVESPCVVLSDGNFIAHAKSATEGTQEFTWTLDNMMSESGQYQFIERVIIDKATDMCQLNAPFDEDAAMGCIIRNAKDNSLVPHWWVSFVDKETGDELMGWTTDAYGAVYDYVSRPYEATTGTVVCKAATATDVEIPWTADNTPRGIQFSDAMLTNTELAHDEKGAVTVEIVDTNWDADKGKLVIVIPTMDFVKDCTAEVSETGMYSGEFGPFPAGKHEIIYIAESETIEEEFTVAEAPVVPIGRVDLDSFNPETGTVGKEVSIYGQIFDAQMSYLPDTKLEWSIDGTPQTPVMSDNQGYFEVLVTGTEVGPTVYAFDPQGVNERCTITWAAGATLGEIELAGGLPSTGTVGTPIKLSGTCWDTELNPMPVQGLPWSIGSVAQTPLNTAQDGTFEVTVNADAAGDVTYSFGEGELLTSTTVTWSAVTKTLKIAEVTPDKCHAYWEYPVTVYVNGPDGVNGETVEFWMDGAKIHSEVVSHADNHVIYDCPNPTNGEVVTKTIEARWGGLTATKELIWTKDLGARNATNRFNSVTCFTGAPYSDVAMPTDLDGAFTPDARVGLYDFETATYIDLTTTYDANHYFHGEIAGKADGTYRIGLVMEGWSGVSDVTWSPEGNKIVSVELDSTLTGEGNIGIDYKITGKFKDHMGQDVIIEGNDGLWMKFVDIAGDTAANGHASFADGKFTFNASGWAEGPTTIMLGLQEERYLVSHNINFGPKLPDKLYFGGVSATKGVVGTPATLHVQVFNAIDEPVQYSDLVKIYDKSDMTTELTQDTTGDWGDFTFQVNATAAGPVTYVAVLGETSVEHTVTWTDSELTAVAFEPVFIDSKLKEGTRCRIIGKLVDQNGDLINRKAPLKMLNRLTNDLTDLGWRVQDDGTFDFEYILPSGANPMILASECAFKAVTVTQNANQPDVKGTQLAADFPTSTGKGAPTAFKGHVTNSNDEVVALAKTQLIYIRNADSTVKFTGSVAKDASFTVNGTFQTVGAHHMYIAAADGAYLGEFDINVVEAQNEFLEFAGVSADRSIGDDYTEATVTIVLKDIAGAGIAGREIKLYNKADMATALTTMTSVAAGWQQYDIYHNGTGDVTYVAVCGDLRAEHTVTWEPAGTKLAAEFSNTFFDTKVKTGKRSRIRGKVADVDYAPLGRKANLKYFNKKTLEDLDVTVKVNKKGFFDFTVGNFGSGANAVILASEQAQENFSISSANANIDMASAIFNASVPRCFRMNDEFKLTGMVYNSDGNKLTATKNQPLNVAWAGNSWDGQMLKTGNWNSTVQFTESGRLVITVSAADNGFLAEHHITVTEDGRLLNPLPICAYKAVVGQPINMSLLLVDENDAPLTSQSITVDLLDTSESTLYWNTNDKGLCEGQITMNTAGTYIAQFWVNGLTLDIPVTWVETTEKVAASFTGIETPQTTDYGLGVTLSGKVLDQDGNHLVGAPVVLFDPVAGVTVPKTEVKNDETGFHYIVNSYGAGEHTFIVSSGNARQNMVVTWNKEADVITTLEATTPNPTIGHLGKTVTVTGTVKNQYGENMVGAAVGLYGANVTLDTTTTETGFTFTVPSDGRVDGDSIWYTIEAGAQSLDYVINWETPPVLTDIGVDPYNRQMLATVAAVELRGRLLDAKGWAYFPDAPVTFELRDGSTVVHTVTTQPDGRWEVTDRGEVEGEFLLTAHVGDKQIGEVHLTRCDNTNRLNPSYLTRLRMMPSKRMPITVLCTNNDGAPSDDGEVEFYLADGDVLIGSGFPSYGECRAWIDAGKLPTVTEPTKVKVYAKYKGGTHRIFFVIEVVPESPLWGVEVSNVVFPTQIPTDETVTVTGNVVNVDGDEVVGARIQLYHLNDMWPLTFDLIKHDLNGFELRVPYYYQGRSKVEVQGDEGYVETPAITWK